MDSEKLNEQWYGVCAQVKSYPSIDASQVDAFFSRLEPQAMSEGFLMLTADNDFIKTWVEQNYLEVIKQALFDLRGNPYTVALAVDPTQEQRKAAQAATPASTPAAQSPASYPEPGAFSAPAMSQAPTRRPYDQETPSFSPTSHENDRGMMNSFSPAPATSAPGHQSAPAYGHPYSGAAPQPAAAPSPYMPSYDESSLVDHYSPEAPAARESGSAAASGGNRSANPSSTLTFGNYVIGDSNRMAYSMSVEVAESPGRTPLNPLFLYGKSGLGKTHLMRAIQNYVEETRPNLRTVYVDSADFLSRYTEAAQAHDREKASFKNFKTYYEEADVLLIDDVQYLQGKSQTLDIVFQLFNTLTNQGKQVVLSADRAPKNIDIDERYTSRFNGGGVIEINPPEIETKLGIVKSFINNYSQDEGFGHFEVSDEVQLYIAENSSSNIRELKSAVTKVIYQMTLSEQADMTIEEVRLLLQNHFSGGASRNLAVSDIQREVESFFKVSHNDLVGPKRARSIVYPRQIAIYLCRQLLDLPYQDIGLKFNRDHTTAMHSVSMVEEMMKKDRGVQEEIEALRKRIREL
ncbi:chromosomal replication initiator protein DnaA [Adlercreutzia equolifaciens]|nr:chromosomal replication initiator protein DnaA [Adlercreutzia equolifaciens]MDE8701630.1 chromosomal replication initiator protein DnaA [Adlercreutzia equolifaciens]